MEGTKNWYNKQYEAWVPWIEDKVLGWWGENKTSYVAKGTLSLLGLPEFALLETYDSRQTRADQDHWRQER